MSDYSSYIDQFGMPGTIAEDSSIDGGDTSAIIGTVMALTLFGVFNADLLYTSAPIRHPDTSKWYGQPDRFSRDQLIPLLCTFISDSGFRTLKSKYFWSHLKRLFMFAWNTRGNGAIDMPWKFPDLTGPLIWALWLRAYRIPSWPLLFILDLELLIGAIIWRFTAKENRVTRNHMLSAIICSKFQSTPISSLAFAITDFDDLIQRWEDHCKVTGEYPTAGLFRRALND